MANSEWSYRRTSGWRRRLRSVTSDLKFKIKNRMVINIHKKYILTLAVLLGIGIFAGFYFSALNKNPENQPVEEKIKITLYKDPYCSCCEDYVTYLKNQGFEVAAIETREILSIKEKYQIPPDLESCHTAVVGNYFIEGHVPIEAIKKLLAEKPDILGIGLAGMPQGSPGMGGIKKEAFLIYGLSKAGEILEFTEI